jgi:tetratricopeptide (TPR) repeat protein
MAGTNRARSTFWLSALLGALTLVACWPVLLNQFIILDDPDYVTKNPHVLSGLSWKNVIWAFTTGYAGNWHPLTWLSHQLDVQLYGLNPVGHHLTSLLLHVANSILLFLLLQRMTAAMWRSAFVAALFALHPLHAESVAWVAERKDVLSTFFFFLTIWAYVRYVEGRGREKGEGRKEKGEQGKQRGARSQDDASNSAMQDPTSRLLAPRPLLPSPFFLLLSLFFFAFGLMSKPMLVTVPFVLLLLDYWPLQRFQIKNQKSEIKNLLWEKLPFLAHALISCIVTYMVQEQSHSVAGNAPLDSRVANAINSYWGYLGKAAWPAHLCLYYPFAPGIELGSWQVLLGGLFLTAISVCAVLRLKQNPWFAVGWFWYLGTLVPVIGLVQVGAQAMADRYTYIPLVGVFICLTWAAADLLGKRGGHSPVFEPGKAKPPTPILRRSSLLLALAGLLLVATCAVIMGRQLEYWRTNRTVFEHAIAVTQNNAMAHCNLANELALQGKFNQAITHLRTALEEQPAFGEARLGLGTVLAAQGNVPEAVEQLQEAVRLLPWHTAAHNLLGTLLQKQEKGAEALREFAEALRLDPNFPDARVNLGLALRKTGKPDDAIAEFRTVLANDPRNEPALFALASTLNSLGRRDEALASYQTVLAVNPDNSSALNDLAWLRATAPEAELRHGAQAVELAERACRLTHYREPQLIGTLAAAYAEAGRFADAIKSAEQAKELATASGRKQLADKNQELLELYRAGKAYRAQ